MAGYGYESTEAWNTALTLASSVGRLRIASNLKAVTQAHEAAFEQAGRACALIAEAATRDGGGPVAAYREARGALAQVQAWLQVIADLMNEQPTVFAHELDLAEQASKQLNASIRAQDLRRDDRRPSSPAPRSSGPVSRAPQGGGSRGPAPRQPQRGGGFQIPGPGN